MIRRFKKLNIMQRAVLAILIFILFSQFAGSTLAWYQSEDERNNHFGVKDSYVDVVLTEPNWDSVGKQQALAMQPGMDIFKNPMVVNTSGDYCFVRMSLDILDSDGDEITDEQQKNAILSALRYSDGVGILTTDENEQYDVGNAELNPDFLYNEGWYYYAPNNTCTALEPSASTTALFTDVLIPCLKSNYKCFEDGFKIVVHAEAVYATETTNTMELDSLVNRFATVEKNVQEGVDSESGESLGVLSLFGYDTATSNGAVDAATSVGAFKEK